MVETANSEPHRIRAIVLTTQRTGSTFLVACLRSHPEIECAGEILNGDPDEPRPEYRGPLKGLLKAARYAESGAWLPGRWIEAYFRRGHAPVRCFKAMYNQLSRPLAMRYFDRNTDIRVIHLRRRNLLKVHVSTLLMTKRRFVQTRVPTEAVWTRVDPAKAIESMRRAREQYERFHRAFERHPRLEIEYERLFDRQYLQADTAREICGFLGVSTRPMGSNLLKLNPDALRDMVTNYDELAAAVSRTEFSDLLD